MPTTVKKIGKKWRVVEKGNGRLARNQANTPSDGGGHNTRAEALAQVRAIYANS